MSVPVLVLATRNAGKVREFTEILAGVPLRIETLVDHPDIPDAPEHGRTYADNAREKAVLVARATGHSAMADDSGLEVDALGGRPGVRSARYSGGDQSENIALLLRELDGVPTARRTARFRCVIAVARPDGRLLTAEGVCEGIITEAPRGTAGFGYDPVFAEPGGGSTFAEISPEHKNLVSHRARALSILRPALSEFVSSSRVSD